MSEKQIDEQILENEITKVKKENEELHDEKDLFLEKIKRLDNNERLFDSDEDTVEENVEREIISDVTEDKENDDIVEEEIKCEDTSAVTKKAKKGKAIFIVLFLVLVGVLAVIFVPGGKEKIAEFIKNPIISIKNQGKENKYNPMGYPVIEGKTFGDAAKAYNMDYKKFLKNNNFPNDIPKNTPIFVAEYYMRIKDVAEKNYGVDYETFKAELGVKETATLKNGKVINVDENTMWYIAKDELPLRSIVKEKDFAEYKTYYNLGEEITLDTLFKEVRPQIESVLVEEVKVKYGLIEAKTEEVKENSEGESVVEEQQINDNQNSEDNTTADVTSETQETTQDRKQQENANETAEVIPQDETTQNESAVLESIQ